jgi:hypothetical protein
MRRRPHKGPLVAVRPTLSNTVAPLFRTRTSSDLGSPFRTMAHLGIVRQHSREGLFSGESVRTMDSDAIQGAVGRLGVIRALRNPEARSRRVCASRKHESQFGRQWRRSFCFARDRERFVESWRRQAR